MGLFRDIRKNAWLYLLALPGIIFLVVFSYLPMTGHMLAFKDYRINKGIWGSPWVGFKNFRFFFGGVNWLPVTRNTLFLNALFIIAGLGAAIVVSLLLNEIRRAAYKKVVQSVIFLPYFVSWMVVSFIVYAMLNTKDGTINRMLATLGHAPISWYSSPQYWPAILTIINLWKSAGYNSVILLAAIAGISGEYYESAVIDGATRFQQMRLITLPLIRTTILVLLLLALGRIFYGDFGMIYGVVGDNTPLLATTDVIDTYSYRALRNLANFSMSSAVVLYQSVMGLIVVVVFNAIVHRVDENARLF
ncbi:MAG: ABC transporter permease subunit [Oscillospiraceae bacterium]|nr:ABC transporter permease subunit [Oscillospiraceae bacterium]